MENINQCPMCTSRDFVRLMDFMLPGAAASDSSQSFSKCKSCGAILRLPLQIFPPMKSAEYGKNYYSWGPDETQVVASNTVSAQVDHYERFRQWLRGTMPPASHFRWLDVGSSGCATSFDDYHFVTVEPSEAAVAYGRATWRAERIHQGVIETFQSNELFDGIVFLNSFYCTPTPGPALERAYCLVRDGGALVVVIGSYFMETTMNSEDGRYSQYEDVWRGNTMWVYHNRLNLRRLCANHGFSYQSELVTPSGAHPHHTLRTMVFRKVADKAAAQTGAPPLTEARRLTDSLLDALTASFHARTFNALQSIDRRGTATIGWADLIAEMEEVRPFAETDMFVDCTTPQGGGRFASIDALIDAVAAKRIDTIATAALRNREGAINPVQSRMSERGIPLTAVRWLMPSRRSDMANLFGSVAGERTFVRALEFV